MEMQAIKFPRQTVIVCLPSRLMSNGTPATLIQRVHRLGIEPTLKVTLLQLINDAVQRYKAERAWLVAMTLEVQGHIYMTEADQNSEIDK